MESVLTKDEIRGINEFRQKRKTAVLAIMFADLVDSTRLTELKGDIEWIEILHQLEILCKQSVQNHGGYYVKSTGDGFMAVYAEPSSSVEAALSLQKVIKMKQKSEYPEVAMRIGIHMGQVSVKEDINLDFFGRHVNRSARVCGIAGGNEIYLTYPVYDSAFGWVKGDNYDNLQWLKKGLRKLKGIDEEVEIYEVIEQEKSSLSHEVNRECSTIDSILVNQTYLHLYQGSITDLESDVIVRSDDTYLTMSGGVSKAIMQKAGSAVTKRVNNLPANIGDVIETEGGNLPAKYIFHAIVIDPEHSLLPNAQIIGGVVEKCLEKIKKYNIESIAFPLIGTGVGDFSILECFQIMVKKIKNYAERNRDLENVWFAVNRPDKLAAHFRKILFNVTLKRDSFSSDFYNSVDDDDVYVI